MFRLITVFALLLQCNYCLPANAVESMSAFPLATQVLGVGEPDESAQEQGYDSECDDTGQQGDGKTDDSKTDDGKTDDSKTGDSKTDDSKTNDSKTNDSKTDEPVENDERAQYDAIDDLKAAMKEGDVADFESKLKTIQKIDAWAVALPTLSDAAQSNNQGIRAATVNALTDIAASSTDKSVALRAIEILAKSQNDHRGLMNKSEVAGWAGVAVSFFLVGCFLWWLLLLAFGQRDTWIAANEPQGSARWLGLRVLIFAIIVICALAFLVSGASAAGLLVFTIQSVVPESCQLWLMLTVFGAFGGLLVSIYYDRLILPRRHPDRQASFDLGVAGDCLFGVAGASVIFLVVPGTFDLDTSWNVIKVVSTAIIGGFAGRALVERVAAQTLKDVRELQAKQDKLTAEADTDATTLAMLSEQFDPEKDPVDNAKLKSAVENSSLQLRVLAFGQARKFRNEMFSAGNWTAMLKTKPVFEALIAADKDRVYHRNYAQLGYLCKDQPTPEWTTGITRFTEAMELRAGDADRFRMYEFSRAICRINCDTNFTSDPPTASETPAKDAIISDLKTAVSDSNMKTYIQEQFSLVEPNPDLKEGGKFLFEQITSVKKWLEVNNAGPLLD